MTNQKLKDNIIKAIECSIEPLDSVDLYGLFAEEFWNDADTYLDTLNELVNKDLIIKHTKGYYKVPNN